MAAVDPPAHSLDEPDPRGALALLADRRFGPYVTGQWLSNTGNWFHNVAIGIVVFAATGSNTLVGVIGGLQYAFTLLLAPVAGQLSDRLDRRRLLLAAQGLGVAGALGLALLLLIAGEPSSTGLLPLALLTSLIGIGYALGLPTLQAYVPSLVPRRDLPQAIALNSVTFNLARAVGPALAGALVAAAGAATAFSINAFSFVVFAAVLYYLGTERGSRGAPAPPPPPEQARPSPWEGVALARRDPLVLTVLLATVGLGFATDPVITLAPALAERLSGGAALVGAIGSAFGVGATLSVPSVTWLRERVGPRNQATAGLALLAAGLFGGAVATSPVVLLLAIGAAGAGFLQAISTLNTTLQLHVEDDVRGRVMAVWGVAFLGVRPIAAAIDGAVADTVGLTAAMCVAATMAATSAGGLVLSRRGAAPPEDPTE